MNWFQPFSARIEDYAIAPAIESARAAEAFDSETWYSHNSRRSADLEVSLRRPGLRWADAALRAADSRGEFELHYQPQISVATGQVIRFEALMRWRHPTQGLLPPARFLPLAEAAEAIHWLGAWAIRRAIDDAGRWPEEIGVAVNVSALQLEGKDLVKQVSDALAATGLAPARLEIELTETAASHDHAAAQATIARLRALGLRLALDDFGTGHATLARLIDLRFDALKIDRRFVTETVENDAVLASVVALARALGIRAVAEGVETQSQLSRIRAHGCHEAQGFLIGRPLPIDETMALIRAMR